MSVSLVDGSQHGDADADDAEEGFDLGDEDGDCQCPREVVGEIGSLDVDDAEDACYDNAVVVLVITSSSRILFWRWK